jgi:hypothetical protein
MVKIHGVEMRTHHATGNEYLLPLFCHVGWHKHVPQRGWSISVSCWMSSYRCANSIQMRAARLVPHSFQHYVTCKPVTQCHFLYWYVLLHTYTSWVNSSKDCGCAKGKSWYSTMLMKRYVQYLSCFLYFVQPLHVLNAHHLVLYDAVNRNKVSIH